MTKGNFFTTASLMLLNLTGKRRGLLSSISRIEKTSLVNEVPKFIWLFS
jgi:hypothetical protein